MRVGEKESMKILISRCVWLTTAEIERKDLTEKLGTSRCLHQSRDIAVNMTVRSQSVVTQPRRHHSSADCEPAATSTNTSRNVQGDFRKLLLANVYRRGLKIVSLRHRILQCFYPRDAMLARSLPSKDACLSVFLSVTRRYCV